MFAVGLKKGVKDAQGLEVEKPYIRMDKEVLVEVVEAGVDGTDRNIVRLNRFEPPDDDDVMIIGHEAMGQVVEVGSAVSSLEPGDYVVPMVRRGCGLCAPCLHGMSDFCQTGLYKERGISGRHGFFTEFFVDEEEYLVRVPPGLRHLAVLTEPLSIAEKTIAGLRHIQERLPWACGHPEHGSTLPGWAGCRNALVIGAGSLGLMLIALLRLGGAQTYVMEIAPQESLRVKLAESLGARYCEVKDLTVDEITAMTSPLDVIIDASGASTLALGLVKALGRNGVFVMTGISGKSEEVCLDGGELMRRLVQSNQVIFGSVNSNRRHFEAALRDMPSLVESFGPVFDRIITSRYSLSEYGRALEATGKDEVKVVFEISAADKRQAA